MPFTANSIAAVSNGAALLANGRKQQFFMYVTADSQATVATAGYFIGLFGKANVGDVIMVVGAFGGTQTLSIYVIQTLTASACTIIKSV